MVEHGDGFAITASYGAVAIPEEAAVATDALLAADQRMYAHKNSGRATARRQSTDVLTRALAERHPGLEGHLGGVAHLAEAVGRHLGLEGEALDHVRVAAELHDVGKVAIPDAILNKAGPLDDDEWAFMRRHTLIGERIVAAAPASARSRGWCASHERWDGEGYRRHGGRGHPLGARVVAVCDAYDAIVSDRPYRAARSAEEALDELHRCAGTQFDPQSSPPSSPYSRPTDTPTSWHSPSPRAARSPTRRRSPPRRPGSRPTACRSCPAGRRRSGRRSR